MYAITELHPWATAKHHGESKTSTLTTTTRLKNPAIAARCHSNPLSFAERKHQKSMSAPPAGAGATRSPQWAQTLKNKKQNH
jgi:hypothetical protein